MQRGNTAFMAATPANTCYYGLKKLYLAGQSNPMSYSAYKKAIFKACGFCTIILLSLHAGAQTEWVVRVDPATGKYVKIDSIPGVMYIYGSTLSCFDQLHHAYLFVGTTPDVTDIYFFSIDAVNGGVNSKAPFPKLGVRSTLQAFVYAGSLGALYGFYGEGQAKYLSTIDITTGSYSIIKAIPGLTIVYSMVFDSVHRQLVFAGIDVNGAEMLYAADAVTGDVINKMQAPGITDIRYNNNLKVLYGLSSKPGTGFQLASYDIAKNQITPISILPRQFAGLYEGNTTFDNIHNRYIINAQDSIGTSFLYSVDAATGNIVYKVAEPETNNVDLDNIIQYRFDNVSGNLYALHWEAHTLHDTIPTDPGTGPPPFIIYPNPLGGNGRVALDTVYNNVTFMLYDALGRLVKVVRGSNTSYINVSRGNLASAVYFYRIICNQKIKATGKLVIE